MSHHVNVSKLRKAAVSALQDTLKNLSNIHVKLQCSTKPFKSERELPTTVITSASDVCNLICGTLSSIFESKENEHYEKLHTLGVELIKATDGGKILRTLKLLYKEVWSVLKEFDAKDCLFVGVIPVENEESHFMCEHDALNDKIYLHWDKTKFGQDCCSAVSQMLQLVREEGRQPTPCEYIVLHLAYIELSKGHWKPVNENTRSLGTPGFRPHTQTYMSLTDPGEGHIMGTTRFNQWMQGAIVHVEHLERPKHLPRERIESYRVPSVLDFSRVRLHVGPAAPTTYFLGRAVKDSGNFENDFLKIVHITAAAASSAFSMGAAECKVAMEGLTTSQAVRYMQALVVQVQRVSRKQVLSAAWNLNQILIDDTDDVGEKRRELKERMDIALKGIEITSCGGFDKVTWDGASDTYPSKCIMYQLTFEEALTIVHEAHVKGLITYFSAGFKFNEIKLAVFAGVDGIGIGGAQVLRFMDHNTGMHGPYTEENIPKIINNRDEAAESVRGRGVNLLVRLDTMYFEGSISGHQNNLRLELFDALKKMDEAGIEEYLSKLKNIVDLPRECNSPFLYRAKRIVEAEDPLLKKCCSQEEWDNFTRVLRCQITARDESAIVEEYDSDPWLTIRQRYRSGQCPQNCKMNFMRTTSFDIPFKC